MQEVLTGELQGGVSEIEHPTLELLGQLGIKPVDEIAGTVVRTLGLPEIARLRPLLVPEYTVFGHQPTAEGEALVSGIADAIALNGQGGIDVIIDWKGGVDLSREAIDRYQGQVDEYRRNTGGKRALLVFMTSGRMVELT
jgi:ATP-dependent helicase/nuclease subunit A